jgi:RNA polymerase sigma-70 factor (sigma-E family)
VAASEGFEDFVSARGQALQRFGFLLTSDWALAEDLVQTAFSRAYPRWSRIESDAPEAYVKKIMVNTWSSWWRRRWRGELPAASLPDVATGDPYAAIDRRHAVTSALRALPQRQRLVLVLRYHEDLSEMQVAELLGVSVGTVKSQAAKALAKLRADGALDGYRSTLAGGA